MTGPRVILDGRPVELAERPLKTGGQALVYPVPGVHEVVVKLYRELEGTDQERRLERMLTMTPLSARRTYSAQQPPELAWPTAIGRGANGEFLGYSMRRFGEPEHVQLIALFNRQTRLRHFPQRADWRFLLGVAWNLAFMTARMHHERLVVGDFSSNNVVVDRDGFVTFLDCDSIAFTDPATGEHFPCLMLTPEYCSPERHLGGPATPASDDFALAVLVYQLLTGGNHPFSGIPHDSHPDDDLSYKDNIISRRSYVVRPEVVRTPAANLDPAILPPELLALAKRAFGPGVEDPEARPKAADWVVALDAERNRVQVCQVRPHHTYGSHLAECPWCDQVTLTGQDLFNEQVVAPSSPVPTIAPSPVPTIVPSPGGHRRIYVVIGVLLLLLLLLLIIAVAH